MADGDTGQRTTRSPPDDVVKAVTDAYYQRLVGAPEAARNRAQAAYVIAGAVAAAVITAGAFAGLAEEHLVVRIVGALALVGWITTAGLFMHAVAAPYTAPSTQSEVFGSREFLEAVRDSAANERQEIDNRQFWARVAAGVASALTVAVVSLAVFLSPGPDYEDGSVRLGTKARSELSALCDVDVPRVLPGEIDKASLNDGTIGFVPDESACPNSGTTSFQEDKTPYILER